MHNCKLDRTTVSVTFYNSHIREWAFGWILCARHYAGCPNRANSGEKDTDQKIVNGKWDKNWELSTEYGNEEAALVGAASIECK